MPNSTLDPVLDALFLPLMQGLLHWPGRGIFLRARAGQPLLQIPLPGLLCEQSFKPDADGLRAAGFALTEQDNTQRYPLVLLLPPRQRDEARALFARAVAMAQPDGRILACAPNIEGARSHAADLARIAGPVTTLSKHKCRVFWSGPVQDSDPALRAQWRELDATRPIADGRFVSRPGVFAWDRIDAGSALLAEHLPRSLRGRAADLGAGFGYLGSELLSRCSAITALDLYEAEQRALDLARLNLASFESRVALGYHWHDVTSGLPQRLPQAYGAGSPQAYDAGSPQAYDAGSPQAYDVIIMNPPFHVATGSSRPDIGRRFVAVAAQALRRGGRLWLVANRHLAYEAALAAGGLQARMVVQQHGYKILEAMRP